MENKINIGLGDFLKSLWIDVKKIWFKKKYEIVDFGLDKAYKEKNKKCDKEIFYCHPCGNNGDAIALSQVVNNCKIDHKCDVCKTDFDIKKKEKVDCERRKYN